MATLPPSHRQLVFDLLAAASHVQSQLDRALSAMRGISLSEFQLLSALQAEHEATATRVDLARAVGLTPSGVTRALRPLEKLGYVSTKKDERDARRSLATLTKHGRTLVNQSAKVVDETIALSRSLPALTPESQKQTLTFLAELNRDW